MAVRRTRVSSPADEVQDAPKSTGSSASTGRREFKSSGWGAPSTSVRHETVKADYLDLRQGTHIVKILNDQPTVWYLQHFVGKGKPPVICYRSPVEACEQYIEQLGECPLCDAGSQASYGYLINVIDLSEDDDVVRKWTFGKQVKDQLISFAEEPATSPLNRETDSQDRYRPLYWMVRQTTSDGRRQTMISPLNASNLRDDYDIEPPTQEQVEELAEKSYGDEALFISVPSKMREFATYVKNNQE